MIAAVANEKGLPVYHLDVSQAFAQLPLKEENFIHFPPSCELSGKTMRLLKCQYGLKQAGREWRMLLVNCLVEEIGLEQCKAESRVFRLKVKDEVSLVVGVHMDEIIVSDVRNAGKKFLAQLKERFPVKSPEELNQLRFRLRLEIMRARDEPDCMCRKPGSAVWNLRDLNSRSYLPPNSSLREVA